MLITILVVGTIFAVLEIVLVTKVHFLKNIATRNVVVGMVLSIVIGNILGAALGLAGVIVGMASAFALVVSGLMYKAIDAASAASGKTRQHLDEQVEFFRACAKVLKIMLIVATSPVWVPAKVMAWNNRRKALIA